MGPSDAVWTRGQVIISPWRWRQYVSQNYWYLPTSSQGVPTQKNNVIFTSVRTSDFTEKIHFQKLVQAEVLVIIPAVYETVCSYRVHNSLPMFHSLPWALWIQSTFSHRIYLKIDFNIIFICTCRPPKCTLTFRYPNKIFYSLLFPCFFHILSISFSIWSPYRSLYHLSFSCYFLSFKSNLPAQSFFLRNFQ